MELGFVTCVQLGLTCMEAIEASGAKLAKIFTLKDDMAIRKSGRVYVDEFAASHGAGLHKIRHVNDAEAVEQIRQLDWLFIIGWSQIAGPSVIEGPKRGVIGIHPTLLPEGRGRAAIPWAILKGLRRTGVTMFKLDEGVDTGPIILQKEIPLGRNTTATDLYQQVSEMHCRLIKQAMPRLLADSIELRVQDEMRATVWPGRKPEDGEIDLDKSVWDAERLVRAVTRPYPGAFFYDQHGSKVVVWAARVSELRPDGPHLQFEDGYLRLIDCDTIS